MPGSIGSTQPSAGTLDRGGLLARMVREGLQSQCPRHEGTRQRPRHPRTAVGTKTRRQTQEDHRAAVLTGAYDSVRCRPGKTPLHHVTSRAFATKALSREDTFRDTSENQEMPRIIGIMPWVNDGYSEDAKAREELRLTRREP